MLVLDHFLPKNDHFRSLLGVEKKSLGTGYEWRTGLPSPTLFVKNWGSVSQEKKTYKKVLKLVTIGPNEKSLMIFQEKSTKK